MLLFLSNDAVDLFRPVIKASFIFEANDGSLIDMIVL